MKRVIVDYKKLNQDILELLVEKFPDGYGDSDIVTFRNASYDLVEAVEVKTEDTIYLVKISQRLAEKMDGFEAYESEKNQQSKKNDAGNDADDDDDASLDLLADNSMEEDFDENL
ncbi:MAG: hypothetical protein OEM04_00760 [Flavobacteriaceae bacterium]|nr:hypothetical protein [Flavobacteriaceae bacterium]